MRTEEQPEPDGPPCRLNRSSATLELTLPECVSILGTFSVTGHTVMLTLVPQMEMPIRAIGSAMTLLKESPDSTTERIRLDEDAILWIRNAVPIGLKDSHGAPIGLMLHFKLHSALDRCAEKRQVTWQSLPVIEEVNHATIVNKTVANAGADSYQNADPDAAIYPNPA